LTLLYVTLYIMLCFICVGTSTEHESAATTYFCLQPGI